MRNAALRLKWRGRSISEFRSSISSHSFAHKWTLLQLSSTVSRIVRREVEKGKCDESCVLKAGTTSPLLNSTRISASRVLKERDGLFNWIMAACGQYSFFLFNFLNINLAENQFNSRVSELLSVHFSCF